MFYYSNYLVIFGILLFELIDVLLSYSYTFSTNTLPLLS